MVNNKTNKIILLLITIVLLTIPVYSIEKNNTHTGVLDNTDGTYNNGDYNGMEFLALENVALKDVGLNHSTTATTCMLYNNTKFAIVNVTRVGNKCSFNYNLTKGVIYNMLTTKDAGWTAVNNGAGEITLPQGNETINFTQRVYYLAGWGNVANRVSEIEYISTENQSGAPATATLILTTYNYLNKTTILSFNATINGTFYTTTTGTIIANATTQGTDDIIIESKGYHNASIYNYNTTVSGNLNQSMVSETDNNTLLTINVINSTGTLLSNPKITINNLTNGTSNPYTENIWNYINISNPKEKNLSIRIEDLDTNYQTKITTETINSTRNTINITMTEHQIRFYFQQDQTDQNYTVTEIRISDTNMKTYSANRSNLTIGIFDFAYGMVKMKFNDLDNWSQYYEYIHEDETTTINETFELLESADYTIYFLIKDYENTELENAIIKIEFTEDFTYGSWVYDKLLGQRLTNADGTTYFLGDTGTELKITVTKEGYQTVTYILTLSDEDYGRTTQFNIYMKKDTGSMTQLPTIFLPTVIYTKQQDILGTLVATQAETAKINTIYRTATGQSNLTLTKDSAGRYPIRLEHGIHFDQTTRDNISVTVYINDTLWRTVNITYDRGNKTDILVPTETLDTVYWNPIILIGLILLCGAMGALIRNENTGTHTFLVGGILLGLIAPAYLWLASINFAYYMMKIAKKIISE